MTGTSLLFTIFAVDKASAIFGKTGSAFTKMAAGIALGAAASAVKTTMMAANFQTNMLKLQTSAGESAGNMKMVSNGVLQLATQTGDSATSLASALYTVESGGQHGANGLLVLKAAAQGAKAEGADLNTVADATTSIMQDYHLKASQAALVTSQLVATTGAGKTTFEQLAGSLHSVLPVASAAHISLTNILGAEAAMTVHGVSADQATQNLADTIRHMQTPTNTMTTELGQLGIKSSSLSGMLGTKGLTGTLQFVSQTILSKMGPSGKVLLGTFTKSQQAGENVKQMIAGMDPAMQKLAGSFQTGSITSKEWTTDLKALSPEQANQMKQFASLQNTASGFTQALKSGSPAAQSYASALAKAMGDSTGLNTALMLTGENTTYTNNAVAAIAKTTTEAGNNVKGWSAIQGTFNVRMAEAKEQIEVTGIRIGTMLLPYATKLVTVLGGMVGWLTKHNTVAKVAAITVGSLAAAVLLYKTYTLGAAVVDKIQTGYLAAKTIVLNIQKAAMAAYGVVQTVMNANLWTWIGMQAIDLAAWISKTAATVANTVAMWAQEAAIIAVSIATKAWAAGQWLVNVAMDANPVGLIIAGIALLVVGILYLWNHCKPFRDFMIAMWHDIWDVLKAIGSWFAGPFAHFFEDGYNKVKNGITDVQNWIHAKVVQVKTTLATIWDTLKAGIVIAVTWVNTHVANLVKTITGLPGRITSATSGMWDGIKNAFRNAIDWIIGKWNNLSFSIPSINTHIPGVGSVGGFTLSTPNIPMLAAGGTAYRAGFATVGDRGPETMFMPAGAGIIPDGGRGGRKNAGAGGGNITVCIHADGSVKDVMGKISAVVRGDYHGDVNLALSGHH